ncbi:hypothetical protein BH23ACT2_BH23ACT2_25930 [soil metagenome]
MTVALDPTSATEVVDLAEQGIHRDPTAPDPVATGSFTQRLVNKASSLLTGRTTTRRSFLTRTAVVGSALAVGPVDFLLKPGTAYGYVCGGCSDGWTAFCCTINAGRNSCPSGSFVAGWWKADNAAFCCGSARYILDCNATCPTRCSCRCSNGDSCDRRRTCCAQFRYGQCNQQISCFGPVVCRVATCIPPWQYDSACTTASATDNRTRDHGANCLNEQCDTAIDRRYAALGGAGGVLGPVVERERAVLGPRANGGRVARYRYGSIYWTSGTGARDVRGRILAEYQDRGGVGGSLGYPNTNTLTSGDRRTKYNTFHAGRIYSFQQAPRYAVTLTAPYFLKHEFLGGPNGVMGYPVANNRAVQGSSARGGRVQTFERGRIYQRNGRLFQTHGTIASFHQSAGGIGGRYGYPVTDIQGTGDGRGGRSQWFEGGLVWSLPPAGLPGRGLYGVVLNRFVANGHTIARPGEHNVGYPTRSAGPVGDGRGTYAVFERGRIYGTAQLGAFQVHGGVLDLYLRNGGPQGRLGYPTSELDPMRQSGSRFQRFENGTVERRSNGSIRIV